MALINLIKLINSMDSNNLIKFQILSDLHLELRTNIPVIKKVAPYLILTGDIGFISSKLFNDFLKYVNETWFKTFVILGNHEFYTKYSTKNDLEIRYKEFYSSFSNIHFLNRSTYLIDTGSTTVEIFGCTLWSKPSSTQYLSDFKKIQVHDFKLQYKRPVTLGEFHSFHEKDLQFLESSLAKSSANYKLVITHFMPLPNKYIPSSPYKESELDTYFSTNLMHLVAKANTWVSGHTHYSFDELINTTRWICNAFCYDGEKSNYNEDLILTI